MRYPTPYIPPTVDGKASPLKDLFIPLGMAGVAITIAFNTMHFSKARDAERALRENGYTAIEIQEGPSWRRSDCNALSLTHFKATDKYGVRREGAVCQPALGGEAKFLPNKLEM